MGVSGAARSTRRSRLSPERESELYEVVLELLREVGYEAMSMPAVATRARCSTATLYRQWQGKPGLVVAALQNQRPGPLSDIDTGTVRGDLGALMLRTQTTIAGEHELFAALEHAGLHDPDLSAAMREKMALPARGVVERILSRAVERGEIPSDGPAQVYCQDLIPGLALGHRLVAGALPDEDYLLDFVDSVLLPALRYHGDE